MRSALYIALTALAAFVSADWELEYHTSIDCTDAEPKSTQGVDDQCVELPDTVNGDYMSIKFIEGEATSLYIDDQCTDDYNDPNTGGSPLISPGSCFGATAGQYILMES